MSERIEDLFDRYVDRLIAGENLSSCEDDSDADLTELLMPLLQTSELVTQQLRSVEPSPQFRAAARNRMRNLFFARLARKDSRPGFFSAWWQRRWATAMVTAMVVCLAGLGVLAASFNALPSGFFYPVKTATEQVRLVVTTSEYERAHLQLEYAERRLSEMRTMAVRGDAETAVLLAGEVTRLLVQMSTSAVFDLSNGSSITMGPSGAQEGVSPVAALRADREEALSLLSVVLDAAPEDLKPRIEQLMTELSREFDATIAHLETRATESSQSSQ